MNKLNLQDSSMFTRREIKLLEAFTPLIERLEAGASLPANSQQLQLLRVVDGVAEPVTALELAWVKLQRRRQYEQTDKPLELSL